MFARTETASTISVSNIQRTSFLGGGSTTIVTQFSTVFGLTWKSIFKNITVRTVYPVHGYTAILLGKFKVLEAVVLAASFFLSCI